jgi:hypothetical protein
MVAQEMPLLSSQYFHHSSMASQEAAIVHSSSTCARGPWPMTDHTSPPPSPSGVAVPPIPHPQVHRGTWHLVASTPALIATPPPVLLSYISSSTLSPTPARPTVADSAFSPFQRRHPIYPYRPHRRPPTLRHTLASKTSYIARSQFFVDNDCPLLLSFAKSTSLHSH